MDDLSKSGSHYNLRQYYLNTSHWWLAEKEKSTLELFQRVSKQVPAYKDFLRRHNIDPAKIKNYQDLQFVPVVTKENYLRYYPLNKLCWGGSQNKQLMYCSTSGSTGAPYYFPRNYRLDWQNSYVLEDFINQWARQDSILAVICFGMGVWIGGVLNYSAFQILQRRDDRPISLIAPGINKKEIIQTLISLAPRYSNVLLLGYPPFIKDLFDTCYHDGINLEELNFKLIFAAECITESFRDYICAQVGITNPLRDVINIYGSADIGGMAVEGPAGIAIRKLTAENNKLRAEFFTTNKSATVAQYNPHFINFDCENGTLLVSGDSVLPLVRYSIGDRGGTFSRHQTDDIFGSYQLNLQTYAHDNGVPNISNLPFVYVYERVDFSVKFYGAIIYPDYVRPAVQAEWFVDSLTGRFCIEVGENSQRDQLLIVHVELKVKITANLYLETEIGAEVKGALIQRSSEFANNASILGDKVNPIIRLWPYGHEKYFKLGIKQQWVKKKSAVT